MSVTIKSPQEIELMREAGKILAKVHEQLGKELKPGMSTLEVDRLGEEMIRSFGCEPSFKGYQGYPASICVSINEEVVHGIPRADRIIEEGVWSTGIMGTAKARPRRHSDWPCGRCAPGRASMSGSSSNR